MSRLSLMVVISYLISSAAASAQDQSPAWITPEPEGYPKNQTLPQKPAQIVPQELQEGMGGPNNLSAKDLTSTFVEWAEDMNFAMKTKYYAEAAMLCGLRSPAWQSVIDQAASNSFNAEQIEKKLPAVADFSLVDSYTYNVRQSILQKYTGSGCAVLAGDKTLLSMLDQNVRDVLGNP